MARERSCERLNAVRATAGSASAAAPEAASFTTAPRAARRRKAGGGRARARPAGHRQAARRCPCTSRRPRRPKPTTPRSSSACPVALGFGIARWPGEARKIDQQGPHGRPDWRPISTTRIDPAGAAFPPTSLASLSRAGRIKTCTTANPRVRMPPWRSGRRSPLRRKCPTSKGELWCETFATAGPRGAPVQARPDLE